MAKSKSEDINSENAKEYTARDILIYFCEAFEKEYKVPYMANWTRDIKIIKVKILPLYTKEQIEATIDYVMKHYDVKWRTKNFPRPTILGLVSFLFNVALAMMQEERKEVQVKVDKSEIQRQRNADFEGGH